MRGTSAKSLDVVLGIVRASADVSGVELFSVVATLDANPALRRVLSDPSTEAAAKVALVQQLFAGKVTSGTVSAIEGAVSGRWAGPRDLADGLETAGVAALVAAADRAGSLDAVESELFEVSQVVHSNADLRAVVGDRSASTAGKSALVADVFAGKINDITLSLVQQAVVARTGSFEKVLDRFATQVASSRRRLVALAHVAYHLDETERTRLASALEAKYGAPVQLNIVVDPSVVGGINVSVGDEVVDATMSTRLEAARRQLAG